MGDMGDIFRGMRKADAERRYENLEKAKQSALPWKKHTDYHWSLTLQHDRLDYWPTKNKFRWRNTMYYGGVEGFIRKRMSQPDDAAQQQLPLDEGNT